MKSKEHDSTRQGLKKLVLDKLCNQLAHTREGCWFFTIYEPDVPHEIIEEQLNAALD